MKIIVIVMLMIMVTLTNLPIAYSEEIASYEPVLITKSDTMKNIIFDGKWSYMQEWKASTLHSISEMNQNIQLRIAHQENFIYILIDVLIDKSIDKGFDKAIICFDTSNDKTKLPNSDDYCFLSTLGRTSGIIFQGGSPIKQSSYYKIIKSHNDFIAISTPSDKNDRYSPIPHGSYEFRVPIDLIGRTNQYGFYLGVYDHSKIKVYTYPENITLDFPNQIPSPSQWGEIISIDNSLPEFNLIFLILLVPFFIIILITKMQKRLNHFTYDQIKNN